MERPQTRTSLLELAALYLRLGATAVGGPAVHISMMEEEVVSRRGWLTRADFLDFLGATNLIPGPNSTEMAIHVGRVRAGWRGPLVAGVSFILPAALMVGCLAWAYVRFGGLPWMQGMFYGIGAAVIAIIARSTVKLTKLTLKKDWLLWAIFGVLAISTAVTSREIIWLVVLGGVVALAAKAMPRKIAIGNAAAFAITGSLSSGGSLAGIFLYFAKAGMFVFGSGLAILPFLYGGVVEGHHWLNDRQFLDAVAVAMITPGPVVITVAFIGFLVAGVAGATAAALGVFLPVYGVVVALAPSYKKWAKNPQIHAFVRGVTAAATGAIAGAVIVLGRRSIYDVPTAVIGMVSLAVLFRWKIPEPALITAAAVVGLILHHS